MYVPSERTEIETRLHVAIDSIKKAGSEILKLFQDPSLQIQQKKDRTLVTEADQKAEFILRQTLRDNFPDDSVVGEEYGVTKGNSPWSWYLDPIDGTQAFVRGVPLFGCLVGLEYKDTSAGGIIFMPALGEMIYAGKGLGSTWIRGLERNRDGSWTPGSSSKAQVSNTSIMKEALFCTTWMQSFKDADCVPLFSELTEKTGVFRGWGDCYGYLLVATGRADIMIDPILESWDAGPLPIILKEAGGQFTCFAGSETIHGRSGVATNSLLHNEVLSLISKHTIQQK